MLRLTSCSIKSILLTYFLLLTFILLTYLLTYTAMQRSVDFADTESRMLSV